MSDNLDVEADRLRWTVVALLGEIRLLSRRRDAEPDLFAAMPILCAFADESISGGKARELLRLWLRGATQEEILAMLPDEPVTAQIHRSLLSEARARLAATFDRHACAACANGTSLEGCPCGQRRTGELVDRIDRQLEDNQPLGVESTTVERLVRERDQAQVERDNARQLLELSSRLQVEAFARGVARTREAAARMIECSPNGGCFSTAWFDRPCERCGKADRIRKLNVTDAETDPCNN